MLDFQGPEKVVYSQSYLIDILSAIHYATPVERASFPDEWKRRDRMREDQGGMAPGGGIGRGQRTGKGPPSRGSYNQGTGGPQKREYGGGAANQYQGTGQGQGGGGNGGQGYGRSGGQQTGGNQYRGQNQYQGGGPPLRDWRAGWTDMRHPKIKEMIDPYWIATLGNYSWQSCLTHRARDRRTYQCCQSLHTQTAVPFFAGIAR
jgi:hypothetical protein